MITIKVGKRIHTQVSGVKLCIPPNLPSPASAKEASYAIEEWTVFHAAETADNTSRRTEVFMLHIREMRQMDQRPSCKSLSFKDLDKC